MMDQADKLRQIIDNLKVRQAVNQANVINSIKKEECEGYNCN